jgi:nucleoid-associated protein
MPIRHCIVHFIDKKPDGNPAALHSRDAELEHNEAADNLLADLNDAYNAKATKGWGLFHGQSGAYPLSGWLSEYLDGGQDFVSFSRQAAEHLVRLMKNRA